MNNCWICGDIADSEEHKFKASDLKRYHGKKMNAFYIKGNEAIKLDSFKDKNLKFDKVICTNCNNNLTRPHDDAYDKFVKYCTENKEQILKNRIINFEEIYKNNWKLEKIDLYRYYAKHVGCKIITSNLDVDITDLSNFIKGDSQVNDFVLKFELKAGVEAIMKHFNRNYKYNHLYNSETIYWNEGIQIKFGGWLTNNYMTTNWIFGNKINFKSDNIFARNEEVVLLTDNNFIESDDNENDFELSKFEVIDQIFVGFENGYNKTLDKKINFFEKLIFLNNI